MSSPQLPARSELSPLEEIFQAIDDEIAAARADPSSTIDVVDGARLHRSIGGSLYSFRTEAAVQLQPETPIEIIRAGETTPGALVAVDDFDIVVHLHEDIGREVPTATLSTSPTFILERLRERLRSTVLPPDLPTGGVPGATWQPDAATVGTNDHVAIQASRTLATIDDPGLHPNESQWRAMSKAAGSDLHFVWGPPGTGKTAALAQTARMLVDLGERVLVLAHANVAVDVAMLRVADAFDQTELLETSGVLRVGDPHHPAARQRKSMLVETAVACRNPELASEVNELEGRRRELTAALRKTSDELASDELASELRTLRQRLSEVRQEYRVESSEAIAGASVIGATLSRFVLSEDVWGWEPDAILLDEASMVSFPWVLLAATRVAKRLVVFGDFRQLPPVYLARSAPAERWLGGDAFEVAGVRARIDDGAIDRRVTLLDTQYRMAPNISSMVSDLGYGGSLRTHPPTGEAASRLSSREPFAGESLIVLDTSALAPGCDVEGKDGSFSRINPLHVALALSLATVGEDCALVTPYRAQARLLAAGLRDLNSMATAATIHRYQGSERDCVIFDVVDAMPMKGPSQLTGGDVDLALRLATVGLSRARGKVIVLADTDFLLDRFAPESPVARAVQLCAERGTVVGAAELPDSASRVRWASGDAVTQMLTSELGIARAEVLLNVPRETEAGADLCESVLEAARRVPSCLVAGDRSLVRPLQDLPCELRLLTGSSLVLLVDRRVAIVGSRDLRIAARLESPALVAAFRAACFGVSGSGPQRALEEGRPGLPPGEVGGSGQRSTR